MNEFDKAYLINSQLLIKVIYDHIDPEVIINKISDRLDEEYFSIICASNDAKSFNIKYSKTKLKKHKKDIHLLVNDMIKNTLWELFSLLDEQSKDEYYKIISTSFKSIIEDKFFIESTYRLLQTQSNNFILEIRNPQ